MRDILMNRNFFLNQWRETYVDLYFKNIIVIILLSVPDTFNSQCIIVKSEKQISFCFHDF